METKEEQHVEVGRAKVWIKGKDNEK